jgi:hypothetical protein
MPKYLKTKEGSLESAVEAVSSAQQAAIAISKKEKAGKPGYDKEGKSLKDDMTTEDKEAYEKFFKSALKKFGVDSPADFKSDEEKKKFFDYVDKNYKGENEETDLEENIMSTPGKDDYIVLIQGPGDNNQKIIQVFKGKSQLNKAKKARDDWNTKNADKIKKNKKGKPISAHMARLYMHPASATLDGKPNIPKVGDKVSWSSFNNRMIKNDFEPVQEELSLAMRTAKHISDMWSEASTKKEVKSEEEDEEEKKEDGKTMTGKPMSKVDTKVVEKD